MIDVMAGLAVYVVADSEHAGGSILSSIRAIEGVNDVFLVPGTSNTYQLDTSKSFNGSSIATRIGVSECVVFRPITGDNHVTLLTVTGMTCNSCVKLIETTVGQMEGINNIKVSLSQSEAFIEYQPAVTTAEKLSMVIYNMGFDASVKIVLDNNEICSSGISTDQVTLSVVGMVCMSCVNNIQTNIGKMAGVKSVIVSLDNNTTTIEYHPAEITPEKLCEAIEDLGFEASTLTAGLPPTKTVTVG